MAIAIGLIKIEKEYAEYLTGWKLSKSYTSISQPLNQNT